VHSTLQAAQKIGVSKNTLLRWIAEGLIPDVNRDWRGWRVWYERDINRARAFKDAYHGQPIPRRRRRPVSKARYARSAAESMARCGQAWKKTPGASP